MMVNKKINLKNGITVVVEKESIKRRGEQYYLCRLPEGNLVEYSSTELNNGDFKRSKPVSIIKDNNNIQFINYRHMKSYYKDIDLSKSELQFILDRKGISNKIWEYDENLINDYNNNHTEPILISPIYFK